MRAVDLGRDHRLLVGRLREHEPPRVRDQRSTIGRLTGQRLADLGGGGDIELVLDRARPQEDVPVVLARRRREVRRNGDELGTLERQDPVQLGETHVVAHSQSELPALCVGDHGSISGLLRLRLAIHDATDLDVEQVDLAVDRCDLAFRIEDDARVRELLPSVAALRDRTADERDPVRPSPERHRRDRFAPLERLPGRVVQRRVRIPVQRLEVRAVGRVEADSDADGYVQAVAVDLERLFHGAKDLLRDPGRPAEIADVGQKDHELVAAFAADGIGGANAGLQPFGDLDQQPVADFVADAVVDFLEAVQIEKQHRDPAAFASRTGQGLLEAVAQQQPIGQPRQRIVVRQERDLLLGGLVLATHAQGADVVREVGGQLP